MTKATYHFPRGFLWGTATAAHQVEGNNYYNNWWTWEQKPGHIYDGSKSGLACDWWGGRWREDFDRAAQAGQNAHRLSIEWSRIQPAPDKWDEHALDYYREMIRGLIERGMTPMVTLHHYTDPQWLAEAGGWENESVINWFEKFVHKVIDAFREYVTLWITFNEPNGYVAHGYYLVDFPPGRPDLKAAMRCYENLVKAHAAAYQAIHHMQPQARVSIAINYRGVIPARAWSPLDRVITKLPHKIYNDFFPTMIQTGKGRLFNKHISIPEAKGTLDFLGLNYYTTDVIGIDLLSPKLLFIKRGNPPNAELGDTGLVANYPQGMFEALKWAKQYNLPILITENGVENKDDNMRRRYLIQHLQQVWRAVNFNWQIKGYFHWTLVDNFEWSNGWTSRFGLWELDPETQSRRKRLSADLYAEICRTNGISAEMVARYAPELEQSLFPD